MFCFVTATSASGAAVILAAVASGAQSASSVAFVLVVNIAVAAFFAAS